MTIKLLKNEYEEMIKAINKFKANENRLPNYYTYKNIKIYKEEYTDAIDRIQKFQKANGRKPNHVTINQINRIQKSNLWLRLEKALKQVFNNPEEMATAFQKHPDYELYYNDKKTRDETLTALAKIGKPGVNCVDISQVVRQILLDMKLENVNIWRGRFQCGGHIWVTYGPNNKIFDAAGMMKWGYGIGKYMCSGKPTELVKNPSWLLSDNGKT
jgi:hypothetical protein